MSNPEAGHKEWAAPVLEQLSVDLTAIANGKKGGDDGNGKQTRT